MIYRFGQCELDTVRRLLLSGGREVAISSKAFDLLCELVAAGGSVVTKEHLLDAVWPDQFVEENNLTVQISALRKALGSETRMISTIPGKGYSFTAHIETDEVTDEYVVESRTIERITVDEAVVQDDRRILGAGGKRSVRSLIAGLAALAIVLAAGSYFLFRKSPGAETKQISSLAVLPFENATNDQNNEYLADGLSENVTYSLSKLSQLKVMSRNAVFRYKNKQSDPRTVGGELNVQAVLTGRVTQRGDMLNISSELISTADNSVIWGETFSRKLSDFEKLQSDIANAISGKLEFKLTGKKPRMTDSADAYRTYLQALYYWNKRKPEDIKTSIELFQTAIKLDPKFGQAYGGLAMAMEVLGSNGIFTKDEGIQLRSDAKNAVARAFEVDADLAEAHAVQGSILRHEWDFIGSEASFKRAIEIDPNFATAHQWYSELLSNLGRHAEALAEIEKAIDLDPYSRAIQMNLGLRYLAAGRTDEAIAQFRKLGEMEPEYPMSYMFLSDALAEKGLLLETLEPDCKADNLLQADAPGQCEMDNDVLREAFRTGGPKGFWKKSLDISLRYAKRGIFDDTELAAAYFRVGDKDRGFELLERAFQNREHGLVSIKVDPPFRDLGDDPRYQSLLKRIGLVK